MQCKYTEFDYKSNRSLSTKNEEEKKPYGCNMHVAVNIVNERKGERGGVVRRERNIKERELEIRYG